MISKTTGGSIEEKYLKKLTLHRGEYEWSDFGVIIRNDGPTMIYQIFRSINPAKRIGVSNIKYESEKATLDKFGNNVKCLLDDMSSNYSTILDKGEQH